MRLPLKLDASKSVTTQRSTQTLSPLMQSTPGSFRRGPPSGSFSRKVSGAGSRLASLTNRRRTSSVISVASSVGGSAATLQRVTSFRKRATSFRKAGPESQAL